MLKKRGKHIKQILQEQIKRNGIRRTKVGKVDSQDHQVSSTVRNLGPKAKLSRLKVVYAVK